MAWTTPRTWVAGEVVSASILNTHVRDNFNAVFGGRALNNVGYVPAADYTTTNTTMTVVDSTNLKQTLTISSGRFMGWFNIVGQASGTAGNLAYFSSRIDGSTMDGGSTLAAGSQSLVDASSSAKPMAVMFLFTGLSAASHYVELMFRTTNAATTAIVKGAGGAYLIRMMGFEI